MYDVDWIVCTCLILGRSRGVGDTILIHRGVQVMSKERGLYQQANAYFQSSPLHTLSEHSTEPIRGHALQWMISIVMEGAVVGNLMIKIPFHGTSAHKCIAMLCWVANASWMSIHNKVVMVRLVPFLLISSEILDLVTASGIRSAGSTGEFGRPASLVPLTEHLNIWHHLSWHW